MFCVSVCFFISSQAGKKVNEEDMLETNLETSKAELAKLQHDVQLFQERQEKQDKVCQGSNRYIWFWLTHELTDLSCWLARLHGKVMNWFLAELEHGNQLFQKRQEKQDKEQRLTISWFVGW